LTEGSSRAVWIDAEPEVDEVALTLPMASWSDRARGRRAVRRKLGLDPLVTEATDAFA
jgi:hypothetical protein